jgi:hypothetical protein
MDYLFPTHPPAGTGFAALERLSREMGLGGWPPPENAVSAARAREVDAVLAARGAHHGPGG